MKYWQIKVQLRLENDKGKIQKVNETYLVDAVSATEAESKAYEFFKDMNEFEVIEAKQSKIIDIIK
jgi:hypothetical protein